MFIKYIDSLTSNNSPKKYALVDINLLNLDKNNPRFSSSTIIGSNREIKQTDIIEYLLRYGNLTELANSINNYKGLYDEEWLSCYHNPEGKLIVLEGNRRVSACKILLDNDLIPSSLRDMFSIPTTKTETLHNIKRLKAVIYDNSQDAQAYIAAKHTHPEVKRWETIEQCNYYYEQFIAGISILDISTNVRESTPTVKKKIKDFSLFKDVFDIVRKKYPDIIVEDIAILPLVTKFMPPIIKTSGALGLGIQLDNDLLKYSPRPENADIYNEILLKIGEAFFVRERARNNETEERIASDKYRISTDEIKNSKMVEALILSNIRIPGLYDLIQKYKASVSSVPVPSSGNGTGKSDPLTTGIEGTGSGPNRPPDDSPPPKTNDHFSEFFSDLKFAHINKTQYFPVFLVCQEIQKISTYCSFGAYKQLPMASAFLLRSLIEQVLLHRLKQVNRYDKLANMSSNNAKRTPELRKITNEYIKDFQQKKYDLFFNDANLAKEFNACFSGYGTKDQLDMIIHTPHLIQPDHHFLNSFCNQGLKKILQAFIDNF